MSDEFYFTVGDAQTEPGLLTVTATSSNPSLIANSNIFINGTGGWRTVSLKPTFGQDGTATITLTVSDGCLTATDTFMVTVQSAPILAVLRFQQRRIAGLDRPHGVQPEQRPAQLDHFAARLSRQRAGRRAASA